MDGGVAQVGDRAAGQVIRHRLLGRLARRFQQRVTLVEAGVGFGKSTLLGQATAEARATGRGVDVVLEVPRTGLDGAQLVDHLVTTMSPGGGSGVDQLVASLWAMAPEEICLVLDDVQWLAPDAAEVLAVLIDRLPLNGHLLLAGRALPAIPLQRLVAARQVDHLTEADLAFDADEQVAFAALRGITPRPPSVPSYPLPPPGPTAAGWPALMELEHVAGRSGTLRYLVEEVLDGLTDSQRVACRRLAVHTTFDDDLVRAVTDGEGSAADLAAALPLTHVDVEGRARFHDLLRDALLEETTEAELASACAVVGEVLQDRREFEAALDVFAAAGDRNRLRGLARRIAADLHLSGSGGRRAVVARLREALPDVLEVDAVWAIHASMEVPGSAGELLAATAQRAGEVGDADLEALCLLRMADLAYGAGQADRLAALTERIEQLADEGSPVAARLGFLPQVWLRSTTNRHAEVVDYLDELRAAGGPTDADTQQLMTFYRTINRAYDGHVRDALVDAEVLANLPSGLFANRLAGFGWIQRWMLGELTSDDLDQVVRLLDHIDELGQTHLFAEGAATTALFCTSLGEVGTARALVARATQQLDHLPAGAWARHTIAQAQAVLAVVDGEEAAAAAILEAAIPPGGIATLPRFIYGATAALSYLLCPSTRPVWDADRCGPDHLLRREVGRALVALREREDPTPAAALPWDDVARLRPWAYEPHLAELAVAAVTAGNRSAEGVFATLRHDPRRDLATVAARAPATVAAHATRVARTLPSRSLVTIDIAVLGPLELRRDGHLVSDEDWINRQRVRDLLLLLVEHRSIQRHTLAELLWPDKPADAAARNLRFTLNRLLRILEPDRPSADAPWYLRTVGSQLQLGGGDRLRIDVDRFEALLGAAAFADQTRSPRRALDAYLRACELYRGDYLTGSSDQEWGYYHAIRLRGQFIAAAVRTCELLVTTGDAERAEELALRATACEPHNEHATVALAATMLARGRIGVARTLVGDLLADLRAAGLTPATRTTTLANRIGLDIAVPAS